ncbi:MAG: hypothetical protein Kow00128_15610 [Deltaproteobacteria bacterium]
MDRRTDRSLRFVPPFLLLLAAIAFSGCQAMRAAAGPGGSTWKPASGAEYPKGKVPDRYRVTLTLSPGQSWSDRFTSTSEMTRTYTDAAGKKTVRTRSVGLELTATQTVASVAGDVARIEVRQSMARILQEGKFLEAPFRRFGPPDPVFFTLDLKSGVADFSEMEKAYAEWMDGLKEGPAGDILGKAFRLPAYLAQLKELYGKPFTRFAGKTLSRDLQAAGEKDFVLPFLGPGVFLGTVPVTTRSRIAGFEVAGSNHYLKVTGEYDGPVSWSADELADRLADFGIPAPASFRSSGETRGQYDSTVDILLGREIRSESRMTYSATGSFDGGTVTEEITGKSLLEPVE